MTRHLYVSLSVCLSLATFPHYCTEPDVTWGNSRECAVVVHCWADLQSVHGFHCCDNIYLVYYTNGVAENPKNWRKKTEGETAQLRFTWKMAFKMEVV